ncbi:pentatricopeptide repeat-containing protein At4g21190 isoform X4 [Cryptomeria japonica]|uniref:pentatricopeptide repeat-containing protein At4g21190 isoform X4 n=1 Tax=Cryptomeria japonica TaxID=3369 RepID=UPI0025AC0BB4|nr:pentatricopeptide repeat-containing protein At4g21190 isoform X4 [Cryptomeria japonica]
MNIFRATTGIEGMVFGVPQTVMRNNLLCPQKSTKSVAGAFRSQFNQPLSSLDEERLLGCAIRLRAIKFFDPVIAKKYFAGHLEKGEDVALKVVECCNNQTKVSANLSSTWLAQWKNFGKTFDELELLINDICFVPPASRIKAASWVCFAKGPRPRKPRIWKTRTRIGTVSKSEKLVQHIKALSNVKEEVYAALDSFIAWEVEFPLITVKKALKTLQAEKEWKRIIQVTKWMLSKGQGKTMGNHYLLLDALAQEQRIEEAEELWNQIFKRHLEYVPRMFFTRVITMYEQNNMPDKLIEVFADMEELGVKPDHLSITIVASTFKNLGMLDKYEKVLKKYPETDWKPFYRNGKPSPVSGHKPQNYGEAIVEQNHSSSNGTERDESSTDDFPTAEDREHRNEMSESLDKRDERHCTRIPISIDNFQKQ